ncbi:membrane protein [Mycobacteroides abscessus subsp. abscessus]|nr:membrane protein [Mycobacteroides abscessus subsp. abscessus]
MLLVLGLLTPLAGAAALAFTVNVLLSDMVSDKANRYAIFWPEGHEFELLMIVAIVAVILVGPGRYGFDAGRGWARRPKPAGLACRSAPTRRVVRRLLGKCVINRSFGAPTPRRADCGIRCLSAIPKRIPLMLGESSTETVFCCA